MTTFQDKRVLIFGGAKGIGRACAIEFARRGASVAIADISSDGAEVVAERIRGGGRAAVSVRCDVGSDESVHAAAEAAVAALGDIDIVMNNVGINAEGRPQNVPMAQWERVMNVNFMAAVRSTLIFLPKMIARGEGHIVNTASIAGLFPDSPYRAPYAASKAALIAMTESLALYLRPMGLHASCFCPGPTLTNINEGTSNWSPDAPSRGPRMPFPLQQPEQSAVTLADGMEAGQVMILSHPEVWDHYRRHADGPDAYIDAQLAAWERYDAQSGGD